MFLYFSFQVKHYNNKYYINLHHITEAVSFEQIMTIEINLTDTLHVTSTISYEHLM